MDNASYITWFQGTSALSLDEHVLTVRVPTTFTKEHLERRFLDSIQTLLSETTGEKIEVCFVVAKESFEIEDEAEGQQRERVGKRRVRRGRPPVAQGIADAAAAAMNSLASPPFRESPYLERQGEQQEQHERDEQETSHGQTHEMPGQHNGYHVLQEMGADVSRLSNPEQDGAGQAPRHEARPSISLPMPEGLLNPRYTFETFIVGKSNKFAHAASQAVAEQPGRVYNPLFLYGGVGLGKTHLLHAVGHTGEAAGLNVLYVTSEKFTNEIINAIRFQKTEEFRAKYRQIDILLVDDIQFIAGKESTEEEFFHTFNSLHNANKQIVVTSDRPPKAIRSLQDRLRSRFEWGLLADVQPPEYEHRLAILRSKCSSLRFTIPNAVIEYIARPECSNVRELEGALNRVIAYATLHDMPITVGLVTKALAHLYNETDVKPHVPLMLSPLEVLEGVSHYYHVDQELVRGKQRGRDIVWPRQVAMYLMRQETSASLQQIGATLGGRDHTTIMHGWERVTHEMKHNDRIRQEIAAVLEAIQRR
jgi:chromosomal replication initiator protein